MSKRRFKILFLKHTGEERCPKPLLLIFCLEQIKHFKNVCRFSIHFFINPKSACISVVLSKSDDESDDLFT